MGCGLGPSFNCFRSSVFSLILLVGADGSEGGDVDCLGRYVGFTCIDPAIVELNIILIITLYHWKINH